MVIRSTCSTHLSTHGRSRTTTEANLRLASEPALAGVARSACQNAGDGGAAGTRPPSRRVRVPSGSARPTMAGVPGTPWQVWMPGSGRTPIVIVTASGVYSTSGAEIRPVAGNPLEQVVPQTRMCSSVEAVPGAGNAGSSAQVAGPRDRDRTTSGSHWPMPEGFHLIASLTTSIETQPGCPDELVQARKIALVASRPASRQVHAAEPGNSGPNFVRLARRASNSGPDAFSAPVGASSPERGNVRPPPQVRFAAVVPEVADGSGSAETGNVGRGALAPGGDAQAARPTRARATPRRRPAARNPVCLGSSHQIAGIMSITALHCSS